MAAATVIERVPAAVVSLYPTVVGHVTSQHCIRPPLVPDTRVSDPCGGSGSGTFAHASPRPSCQVWSGQALAWHGLAWTGMAVRSGSGQIWSCLARLARLARTQCRTDTYPHTPLQSRAQPCAPRCFSSAEPWARGDKPPSKPARQSASQPLRLTTSTDPLHGPPSRQMPCLRSEYLLQPRRWRRRGRGSERGSATRRSLLASHPLPR